jgi:hypothetical protein
MQSAPPPNVPASGRARPPVSSQHSGPVDEVVATAPRRKGDRRVMSILVAVVVLAIIGLSYRVASHTVEALGATPAPTVTVTVGSSSQPIPAVSGAPSAHADPNSPSGEPMPSGNLPGWRQTFFDDFTGTKLSKKWVAYDGQPRGDTALFNSARVSVANGMASIDAKRDANGVFTTGGMSNSRVFEQTYGKFDVRFRMDKGWGVPYAILLWPQSNESWPEIDFAEDNGGDRTMTSASLHTLDKKNIHRETNGDFTAWHTAELVWLPGKLTFAIDGHIWTTITGAGVPDSTKMVLAIQSEVHACGSSTWEKCPNKTTPDSTNLQIDWVSIYAPA